MKSWHRERWRKLYRSEPPEQEAWFWAARGLRDLLIRRAADDGRVGTREMLKAVYRGDVLFDSCVETLLDDGFLVADSAGMIFVRNLPTAQGDEEEDDEFEPEPVPENESPDERRKRLQRDRQRKRRDKVTRTKRDGTRDSDSVTERDSSSPPSPHTPLPPSQPESQKNQPTNQPKTQNARAAARDSERDGTRDSDSVTERDRDERDSVTTPLRSLTDALAEPIGARAQRVQRDQHLASYLQPHQWPEVQSVSDALCEAMGRPKRVLAEYSRDSGVRAVVALYAAGYLPGDLERAARLAPKNEWWNRDGARRGLSTLTPEVVDRALHDPSEKRIESMVRQARESTKGPAALGSLLPKLAGGTGAP